MGLMPPLGPRWPPLGLRSLRSLRPSGGHRGPRGRHKTHDPSLGCSVMSHKRIKRLAPTALYFNVYSATLDCFRFLSLRGSSCCLHQARIVTLRCPVSEVERRLFAPRWPLERKLQGPPEIVVFINHIPKLLILVLFCSS
jgi:hypothetical protein